MRQVDLVAMSKTGVVIVVLVLVAVGLAGVLLFGPSTDPPVKQVDAAAREMVRAVLKGDADGVLRHVSERFQGGGFAGKTGPMVTQFRDKDSFAAWLRQVVPAADVYEAEPNGSQIRQESNDRVNYAGRFWYRRGPRRKGGGFEGEIAVDAVFVRDGRRFRAVSGNVQRVQ